MITYHEIDSKAAEFHDAYNLICLNISAEFVEPEDYLRYRFNIQQNGAENEQYSRLISDGYRIRAIVAKDDRLNIVVGAALSSFVPKIGNEKRGFALFGFLSVAQDYQRRGIGTELAEKISKILLRDSLKITEKPAVGLLFEIEIGGQKPIERLVNKMGGYPLDIDYYQPSLRPGFAPQQMNLWFAPFDHPLSSAEEALSRTYPPQYVHDMVKSLLVYEYPRYDKAGSNETSVPYRALVASLKGKTAVGFKIAKTSLSE